MGRFNLQTHKYCHIWQMFHLQHFVLLKRIQTARYQELQSTVWILNEVLACLTVFCYRSNYICWPPEDKATQVFFICLLGQCILKSKKVIEFEKKISSGCSWPPVWSLCSTKHEFRAQAWINKTIEQDILRIKLIYLRHMIRFHTSRIWSIHVLKQLL